MLPQKDIQVIVVDDDYIVRHSIIHTIKSLNDHIPQKIFVYGATNGLDGLGSIFLLRPDVIIIDTTLPKYSGREVVEFISTNKSIVDNSLIIILNESNQKENISNSILQIDKSNDDFLEQILNSITLRFNDNLITNRISKIEQNIIHQNDKIIKISNETSKINHESIHSTNPFRFIYLLLKSIIFYSRTNISYFINSFEKTDLDEDSIYSPNEEFSSLRTPYFFNLFSVFAIILFAIGLQLLIINQQESLQKTTTNRASYSYEVKSEEKFIKIQPESFYKSISTNISKGLLFFQNDLFVKGESTFEDGLNEKSNSKVYPAQNETVSSNKLAFSWVTQSGKNYDIYLNGVYFDTFDSTTSSFELDEFLSEGSHTWQIVSYQNNKILEKGPVINFEVKKNYQIKNILNYSNISHNYINKDFVFGQEQFINTNDQIDFVNTNLSENLKNDSKSYFLISLSILFIISLPIIGFFLFRKSKHH